MCAYSEGSNAVTGQGWTLTKKITGIWQGILQTCFDRDICGIIINGNYRI